MTIAEIFTYVTTLLSKIKQANLSEKSEKDYFRTAGHFISIAQIRRQFYDDWDCPEFVLALESARFTKSISTWRTRKNALKHHYRLALLEEFGAFLAFLGANGLAPDDQKNTLSLCLQGEIGKLLCSAYALEQVASAPPIPLDDRDPRHSKVKDLKGLPENPALILMDRCPKYRLAILLQAVSGCRPGEIEKGVSLKIAGQFLVATIYGLKTSSVSGQPLRMCSYRIDPACEEILLLAEEVRAGLSEIKILSAARYCSALIKAGNREWPDRKVSFSPYCLRHLAASDMKASNLDPAQISAALGHCSDRTREYYGRQSLGRKSGGVAPSFVEATRPVRQTKRRTAGDLTPTMRIRNP